MPEQVLACTGDDPVDQTVRFLAPGMLSGENRKPDQVLGGDPIRIGRCFVGGGARPHYQAFGIVGGEEEAAGVGIGVVAVERRLPLQRLLQIAALARRLVERERGADHGGVVGGEPREQQPPVPPGMAQALPAAHLAIHTQEGARRHLDPSRLAEGDSGIDQSGDHQPVPVGEDFVVEPWADSLVALA